MGRPSSLTFTSISCSVLCEKNRENRRNSQRVLSLVIKQGRLNSRCGLPCESSKHRLRCVEQPDNLPFQETRFRASKNPRFRERKINEKRSHTNYRVKEVKTQRNE